MIMRIITGHTLARRCFEPVVGAGQTWTRVPESVRQPAFAAVIDGARPASTSFPLTEPCWLFRSGQVTGLCVPKGGRTVCSFNVILPHLQQAICKVV